jgi:Ca2+-dependent lipid-binding protein
MALARFRLGLNTNADRRTLLVYVRKLHSQRFKLLGKRIVRDAKKLQEQALDPVQVLRDRINQDQEEGSIRIKKDQEAAAKRDKEHAMQMHSSRKAMQKKESYIRDIKAEHTRDMAVVHKRHARDMAAVHTRHKSYMRDRETEHRVYIRDLEAELVMMSTWAVQLMDGEHEHVVGTPKLASVRLLRASGLAKMDRNGKADPYVVLRCGGS